MFVNVLDFVWDNFVIISEFFDQKEIFKNY